MLKNSKRLFGEILVSEGHLTKDQLEAALAAQAESGYPLGDVMLQQGWITESDVVKALCIQYQLPFIRPSTYELRADLLQKLPPPFLYQNRLIPLDRFGDCFIVAIADVPAEPVQRELADTLGGEVFYYFAPIGDVEPVLREQFSYTQEELVALNQNRDARINKPRQKAENALFEDLDASSWGSIFDEAEKNV